MDEQVQPDPYGPPRQEGTPGWAPGGPGETGETGGTGGTGSWPSPGAPAPGPQYGPQPGPPTGGYGPQPGSYGPQYGPQPGPPPGPYGPQYGAPPGPQYGPEYGPEYGPPPGEPYRFGPESAPHQAYGPPPPSPYGSDVIGSAQPPRRSRGRALWAGVATAAVVALTAGGVYAYTTLSGGGAELASKVPGDAVAYAEVNLDPPAGQKVAAIRFLRHFPDAKIGSDSGSLLESVVEPLISDPVQRKVFAEDVKPWVGKHVAVAGDPQGGEVRAVVVVEATDTAEARAGLDRFNTAQQDDEHKVRYAISGDVVYVGELQPIVDAAARDAGSAPLSENGTFSADVEKAGGDEGIITFWANLAEAAKLDPAASGSSATAQGRIAGSLRFTDTTADLTIQAIGNPAKAGSEAVGPRLRTLPADTVAAAAVSGGDQLVRSMYDQLGKAGLGDALSDAEEDLGLTLPDDIEALVGTSTVLAIGGTSDEPQVGMVSKTREPEKARAAAEKILTKLDEDSSLTVRSTADGTVLASSAEFADALTLGGTLGQDPSFTAALPDLDGAHFVLYVDVQKAARLTGEEVPASAKAVRAFGVTAGSSGDSTGLHLRLVVG